MEKNVLEFLKKGSVKEPISFKNLKIYPITIEDYPVFAHSTLGESISNGDIKVEEINEQGHVPELFVTNESMIRVFLMDGEEVIGAKQNRILNTSIIIESKGSIKIPVSCVEQGRWNSKGRYMEEGEISHSKLRGSKANQVYYNLKSNKVFASNQSEIWNEVDEKLNSFNINSHTRAMHDVIIDKEEEIKSFADNIPYIEGSSGVIVIINEKIVCADIFGDHKTLKKLWKKLISSYALDALDECKESSKPIDHEAVLLFLKDLEGLEYEEFKSPGLGKDIRFENKKYTGSALVCDNKVIHLSAFRRENKEDKRYNRMQRPSRRYRNQNEF
jgi:hypothetical protein